nr:alpha/beta fold hydrolase [Fodinicola feengrottensis]
MNGTDVLRVGRQQLHVDIRAGEGTPLLLCNGIGANLELMRPFVERLEAMQGRRIPTIAFDVPGTGGSPTPRLPRWMTGHARLLRELVTKLGFPQVDVLGISWGGALAQEFAHLNPKLCRRVVLCATSMGMVMVPAHPRVLLALASPTRYFRPSRMRELGAAIYGGGFWRRQRGRRRLRPGVPGAGSARLLLADARRLGLDQCVLPARCCANRCCWWPATTTRSSRW